MICFYGTIAHPFQHCIYLLLLLTAVTGRAQSSCCNGVVNTYSKTHPDYHFYSVVSKPICNISERGCTKELVYEVLTSDVRFVAPTFDDTSIPVNDCGIYRVQFFPLVPAGGNICVRTNSAQKSLTNYTLPNHFLHPGKVLRQLTQNAQGDIILFTVGEGTGSYPVSNTLLAGQVWQNELASFWKGPNTLLIEEVRRRLPKPYTLLEVPANLGDGRGASPVFSVQAGDLVIVEVMNTVSLGFFTPNVPAYGLENGARQMYNKAPYQNLNHGTLICLYGSRQPMHCVKNPFGKLLSLADRSLVPAEVYPGTVFLANADGTLSFDINDTEPSNNSGSFEVNITVVPRSRHKSSDVSAALKTYLTIK